MSRTAVIEYEDRMIWGYDEARGIWMKYLIEELEEIAPEAWTDAELDRWRAVATMGVLAWMIELTADQKPRFLAAGRNACDRLTEQRFLSLRDVKTWYLIDTVPLIQSIGGPDPIDTAPIVELGRAVLALVDGTLDEPPPHTAWYFGLPSGRTTIGMDW